MRIYFLFLNRGDELLVLLYLSTVPSNGDIGIRILLIFLPEIEEN